VAVPPFPVEQPYPTEINGKPLENYTQWFFLTYGITLTGLPAISVPCGFTRSGLPVGLQIVGRRQQEAAVLRAAAAFERAAPWADRIPPVVKESREKDPHARGRDGLHSGRSLSRERGR
jgi:amidase